MNLHELATEYCELMERADDEEDDLDEDEQERLKQLAEFNAELNDLLYFPNKAMSATIVEDEGNALEQYGVNMASEMHGFNTNHPLSAYVNFREYAEEMLTDFMYVQWEGINYYVEEV